MDTTANIKRAAKTLATTGPANKANDELRVIFILFFS
jgi:hypothetical protein